MKAASRFLSVFLALAVVFSCSACASGTDTAAGKEEAGQEGTGEELSAEAFLLLKNRQPRLRKPVRTR